MKCLRNLCATATLLFVLSLSAQAGEITIWGVAPPPPPPPSVTITAPGEITTWGATSSLESEVILSIFQLLSRF